MNAPVQRCFRRGRSERGSAVIEFLLCASFFLIPLLMGSVVIGMDLIYAVQVTEVCRDAAHMYSYGIDFSQTANQNQLVKIGQGLNMTASGGNTVVILSTVTYISLAQCQAGGYSNGCTNQNQDVITNRLVIGNSALKTSAFGTPNSSIVLSNGDVTSAGYLNDTSARAVNFQNVIALSAGQNAYMAETYFTPNVSATSMFWWKYLGTPGIAARSIF